MEEILASHRCSSTAVWPEKHEREVREEVDITRGAGDSADVHLLAMKTHKYVIGWAERWQPDINTSPWQHLALNPLLQALPTAQA